MPLHMVKLCVGCDTVDELVDWHLEERATGRPWIMPTRQTPKRADELTAGGSLYRVFRGMILCRQRILAVDCIGAGPASRCEVTLDLDVMLVAPTPRRAFQGWRYLLKADAPPDLAPFGAEPVPQTLARELRSIGAW
ncbi:MAG TPA: DUF1489 domain-containing protein [Caulobacteraceae bacterium]|jgi:hypothetical protein